MKLQSAALEYLVTYAWLIIVLGALAAVLFYFIPFAQNVGGRVEPGSCIVDRPYGPGTTQFIKLAGVCDNDLPEYVAKISGASLLAGDVNFTPELTSAGQNSITMVGWGSANNVGDYQYLISYVNGNDIPGYPYPNAYLAYADFCGEYGEIQGGISLNGGTFIDSQCLLIPEIRQNVMTFYAVVYNGNALTEYQGVNGQLDYATMTSSLGANVIQPGSALYLGGFFGSNWDGYISNIQIYNTSLSTNALQDLYLEGVGGDPIDLTNLVGWWPLNGDDTDYSGDYNNNPSAGASCTITYTNIWPFTGATT